MRVDPWCSTLAALSIASAMLAAGCSCATGRPATRRDTGAGPGDDTGLTDIDADIAHHDANFPDTNLPDFGGPRGDTGCDLMTPVMNEIIGDPPDMLIVLDISGSMCEPINPLGGTMTKLGVMKTALNELVTTFDARINFGLMKFPGDMDCGPGVVTNPIMPHNAAAIMGTLSGFPSGLFGCATFAGGNTPTFRAISAAQDYYATIPVNPVGQFVLLATDGLPNCGAVTTTDAGTTTAPTVDETVAAIQSLHDAGIPTYVLGFGSGFAGDPAALMRMAVAGGTSMPYNARNAAELSTALSTIAAGIIPPSCTIALDGSTRNPALFQVSFDGGPLIPRDTSHASGWDYDEATNTITFYGSECATVEAGSVVTIDVEYGCPGPLV